MKKSRFKDVAEWLCHREFMKLQERQLIANFRSGKYYTGLSNIIYKKLEDENNNKKGN